MGNLLTVLHDLDLVTKALVFPPPYSADVIKFHRHNPYLTLQLPRILPSSAVSTSSPSPSLQLHLSGTTRGIYSTKRHHGKIVIQLTPTIPILHAPSSTAGTQSATHLIKTLPLEIWQQVLSHLYPSQLARLCLVNKRLFDLVTNQPVWSTMYHAAFPKETLDLLPGMPTSRSYMLFMCAYSFLICEQCFVHCNPKDLGRKQLASLPLKVFLPWASDNVKLCPQCRVQHYEQYPEPIPEYVRDNRRSRCDIRRLYNLDDSEIRTLTRFGGGWEEITFSEEDALALARHVYGGDVGLAALPRSLAKSLAKSNNRVYVYILRRQVLSSGSVWKE
ncbi:hypothetical protein CPC16_010890 [Podila verticillata]|nr:hypothetical protein BGZ52_011310 [Haplosporangium bisporale]KAF9211544.1 hypothetical protein BGZ59_007927 [Podila verticillata]KAF9394587.1 hypothetical protein CPC16_010890 [Podila verticillata]KAI9231596.1 MAG: hypothetical protein BYD32DRAFT_199235 [Podila humilis]KFH73382.1 hypothetical protein MVEG_00598 [Podila verticillata NRRL 6337]